MRVRAAIVLSSLLLCQCVSSSSLPPTPEVEPANWTREILVGPKLPKNLPAGSRA